MLFAITAVFPSQGVPAHGVEQHFELVAFLFGVDELHDRHQATDVFACPRLLAHTLDGQVVGVLVHRTGAGPCVQGMLALALRRRDVLAQQGQQVDVGWQAEFAEFRHRLALVLQQVFGQAPATVQRPDQLTLGHFHGIEEHLAERRFAADQIDRLRLDARAAHVQHNQADAFMLGRTEISAHQGIHPVGFVTVGGPDFAAVDDKMITGITRGHFQVGQVRTGVRLGKALTPAHFPTGNGRQQVTFLLLTTVGQQYRAKHPDAQVDLRRPAFESAHLAFEHGHLLIT